MKTPIKARKMGISILFFTLICCLLSGPSVYAGSWYELDLAGAYYRVGQVSNDGTSVSLPSTMSYRVGAGVHFPLGGPIFGKTSVLTRMIELKASEDATLKDSSVNQLEGRTALAYKGKSFQFEFGYSYLQDHFLLIINKTVRMEEIDSYYSDAVLGLHGSSGESSELNLKVKFGFLVNAPETENITVESGYYWGAETGVQFSSFSVFTEFVQKQLKTTGADQTQTSLMFGVKL